jgi:phage shock protein A
MMQSNEIQQQYNQAETAIRHAAQRCESTASVPMDLKSCIQQLDQQSSKAREAIQSEDEDRIRQCIDEMEELGDKAKAACENGMQVDAQLRESVMQAHERLSNLKHQLH